MKISVVIVIYNKDISQSITCQRIKFIDEVGIVVVDNSTIRNSNRQYCETNNVTYLYMGGNKGLSKAYNAAISYLKDLTDVIVLLDDDTEIPSEYFDKLKMALTRFPDVDIFAPIIRGQDGIIYSPNNYNFLKNHLLRVPQKEVKQARFNAISSCLAIRMRVFEHYRYNEKLFVDEIDHCFFREQRERGKKFGVLDIDIVQNFHQRQAYIIPDAAWNRIQIRIKDIFHHARLIGKREYILLAFIKCCGLSIQIGNKSKSLLVAVKALLLSCKLLFIGE